MKFYCDSCQTKYSISDEKVRGKVLKVRCKKCSHVITVREPRAPVASVAPVVSSPAPARPAPGARPGPPPPPPGPVQWHYAINGQSFGPFKEADLEGLFESGALGDGVYVWNETFTAWKPATEVELFAAALREAAGHKEGPRTLGVSQPMFAINADEYDAGQGGKEAAAPHSARKPEPQQEDVDATEQRAFSLEELEARAGIGVKKPDDKRERTEGPLSSQSLRLQALRERLQLNQDPEQPAEKQPGDEGEDLALAATLPDSSKDPQGAAVHDGLFSGSYDEPLEDEGSLAEESEGEDVVPFFASAPKLKGDAPETTSMSRMDEISGSLLIQINAIKGDGRKRALVGSIAAVVALIVVGSIVYFGFVVERDEVEIDDRPRVRADHIGQAPVFREYTDEERSRAVDQIVLEEALVISRADGQAALAHDERAERGQASGATRGDSPAMPRIDPEALRRGNEELGGTRAGDDEERAVGSRFQRPGMVGSGGEATALAGSEGRAEGGAEEFEDERLRAMAALQTDTARGVYNPREEFDELVGTRERLSNQDIAVGMQNVVASVGSCRERHILRGGTLEHDRVDVTLQIETTGRVESMALSPAALADTDFGRCMRSHIGRWRFPPFRDGPIEVQTPLLLQE